jgi:hypothetical protein
MQSAPNYRKDLNVVVEAPDGNFVSYCGVWYEPENALAYVEPVATDPDYLDLPRFRGDLMTFDREFLKSGSEGRYSL